LVEEGPAAIEQLIEWGAEFDREGAKLAFTREGAHSRNRILHAHGDSTGKEIARTLYRRAASLPNVTFRSFAATTGLLVDNGEICGAQVLDAAQQAVAITARAVLLATGGLGRVFLNTTNPEVATGDGVAMAYRAGAEISDIEFVQFHPTALHVEGAPRFLLSEALRGEGARLINEKGERFMERYHPLGELAPRDVVARAIVAEMNRSGAGHVFLDISGREPGFVPARFPRIYETCLHYGIDLERQPAPVAPAAHYAMGGVRTDLGGRTTLPNLFAAGEVACTGVHGANRLASNSLLEGVVFGARAGQAMLAQIPRARAACAPMPPEPAADSSLVHRIAWEHCGIVRDAAGLKKACRLLARLAGTEAEVALLIARSALAREESRGAHFRSDFPEKKAAFAKHSVIQKDAGIYFSGDTN
jgi:L-aspartate oxidase